MNLTGEVGHSYGDSLVLPVNRSWGREMCSSATTWSVYVVHGPTDVVLIHRMQVHQATVALIAADRLAHVTNGHTVGKY